MLQPSHRGIYEYLWSEHKYPIMGVSIKAFQSLASKLGRKPLILQFLRKLEALSSAEKPEWFNGILNAYMHVKPLISRDARMSIIETVLNDEQNASQLIYETALKYQEKSLYGCRIFFDNNYALYKFWDAQDKPGLWSCFGPFQQHLTTAQVITRIMYLCNMQCKETREYLSLLQDGLSANSFAEFPTLLQTELKRHNMVASPGNMIFLHPRIKFSSSDMIREQRESDLYEVTALILERIWDCEDKSGGIGILPDFTIFKEYFEQSSVPDLVWKDTYTAEEAYDFLLGTFWKQISQETGLVNNVESQTSGHGIGMETTDEEIDPEEGEHCDEETCY